MIKGYRILIALLLSISMIISLGSAGMEGFAEEDISPRETDLLQDELSEDSDQAPGEIEEEENPDQEDSEEDPVSSEDINPDEDNSLEDQENPDQGLEDEDTDPADGGEDEEKDEDKEEDEEENKDKEEDKKEEEIIKANLKINHILLIEGREEIIGEELIEGLEVNKAINIGSMRLEDQGLILVGDSTGELIILQGENTINLYYERIEEEIEEEIIEEVEEEPEEELGTLTVNHILVKRTMDLDGNIEEIEELIGTDYFDKMKVDSTILKGSLKLESEEYIYIEGSDEEYTIVAGENELNLYYKGKIQYADLKINHILKDEEHEELGMTETIEKLEVESLVYSYKYIFKHDNLIFLEADKDKFLLAKEDNVINLYYQLKLEDEYIAENPDFHNEEGESTSSPRISRVEEGSLGPEERVYEVDKDKEMIIGSQSLMRFPRYRDEINNKLWPEEGSIFVNKTGEAVEGSGNKWEISLELEGRDIVETSDIVIVIDRSASMEGQKMEDAKEAAKEFINTLLEDPKKTHVRIALVSFAGDVSIDSNFINSEEKDQLLSAIHRIRPGGGTHIQGAVRQARELLKGSQADFKNIVLLGDGAATYSYELASPERKSEHWYNTGSGIWFDPIIRNYRTGTNLLENDFIYNSTVGNGYSENYLYKYGWKERYYYRHGASAIAEAGFAKTEESQIYAIGLDAGSEGDWTLENIADSGNYYQTPDSKYLSRIFEEIAGKLISATREAKVTDPIGEIYSILGINEENYQDLIEVSHGSISYDSENQSITWDIGDVDEGEEYFMKYIVALDYSAEGGVFYPLNHKTYIDYINIDDDVAKKYFPIPEFRLRALTLSQILENEDPDEEFHISLEGPAGIHSKTWSVSLKNNESKTIKGLIPGSYTITETVPMNYQNREAQNLVIGEDDWTLSYTTSNKRINTNWFYHMDRIVNNFKNAMSKDDVGSKPKLKGLANIKLDEFIVTSLKKLTAKEKNLKFGR